MSSTTSWSTSKKAIDTSLQHASLRRSQSHQKRVLFKILFLLDVKARDLVVFKVVIDATRIKCEICRRWTSLLSWKDSLLVVARLASVNFTLATRIIYRFLSRSIRADLMFLNFHTCYSTRYIDESLDITRDTRSSSLDALVTIAHRRSTYSSRSFIVTREFHSRSFNVISDRSASTKVVKNKLIEAREDFKRKILSRF